MTAQSERSGSADGLRAAAARKRSEAANVFDQAGVVDMAATRLSARVLEKVSAGNDLALARHARLIAEAEALEHKATLAEGRVREEARKRFLITDLRGASAVKDHAGWHQVVRISERSVSVETEFSWTTRIPVDRVLDVRYGPSYRKQAA